MINGPDGVYGNVSFSQNGCGESVFIEISVIGLKEGDHGFHIHEKGDLTNGCLSTGGHYNPEKVTTIGFYASMVGSTVQQNSNVLS